MELHGRLIDDVLAYARVGTRGAAFQPTDCEAVLERALANLEPSIDETGAVVTHDPLPSLWADGTQMGQLFQNLIGNAIKYRGDAPPRIHIAAERQGEEWVFSVRDNGIGFDPEHAERIFTIFQRLHDTDEYPGTGIGLAICKKIVERHAGRIWAESEPGRGSRFSFTIPARRGWCGQWQSATSNAIRGRCSSYGQPGRHRRIARASSSDARPHPTCIRKPRS